MNDSGATIRKKKPECQNCDRGCPSFEILNKVCVPVIAGATTRKKKPTNEPN